MKLLFYIDTIGYGGAERVIANLANQFYFKGYQCTVVTSFEKSPEYTLHDGVKRLSLNKTYIDNFYKRNFLLTSRLRKILKQERPDIAVVFLPEAIFRTSIASLGLNHKLIFSVRNDPKKEYGSAIYKRLGSVLLPKADGIVFQTKDAQSCFSERIQKISTVIFNQVDSKFYEAKITGSRSGIVTTGRLAPQKNHKLLIDAFSLITDRITDNLTIYGEGFMMDDLKAYVKSKGLQNRVALPGPVQDVDKIISNNKLYVLSSDYEGLPNGLMEAMALGLPCVSTDCPSGGPRALFGTQQSCYLVPVNDSASLANAIYEVVSSETIMKVLSEENRKRAMLFSPSEVILRWEEFIMSIYNKK